MLASSNNICIFLGFSFHRAAWLCANFPKKNDKCLVNYFVTRRHRFDKIQITKHLIKKYEIEVVQRAFICENEAANNVKLQNVMSYDKHSVDHYYYLAQSLA